MSKFGPDILGHTVAHAGEIDLPGIQSPVEIAAQPEEGHLVLGAVLVIELEMEIVLFTILARRRTSRPSHTRDEAVLAHRIGMGIDHGSVVIGPLDIVAIDLDYRPKGELDIGPYRILAAGHTEVIGR